MHTGILVLAIFCLLSATCNAMEFCVLNYPEDYPKIPAARQLSFSAWFPYGKINEPRGGRTIYTEDTKAKLSCTGPGNVVTVVNQPTLEILCSKQGKWVSLDGKTEYNYKDLGCKKTLQTVIKRANGTCADNLGQYIDVGISVEAGQVHPFYYICFNHATKQPFFTMTTMTSAVKAVDPNTPVGQLRANYMGRDATALNSLYTPASQIPHFQNLYGASQSYVTDQSYLKCAQLTDKDSFADPSWQSSTRFYMNCAPQFTTLSNWKRVEQKTRWIITNNNYGQETIQTFTGTFGTLQLENASNKLINATVDSAGTIQVPEAFFKVVRIPTYEFFVVFITVNNPYASKSDIVEICPNVCDEANVNDPAFSDPAQGYTYCCDLGAFQKVYKYFPFMKSRKVLNMPKA